MRSSASAIRSANSAPSPGLRVSYKDVAARISRRASLPRTTGFTSEGEVQISCADRQETDQQPSDHPGEVRRRAHEHPALASDLRSVHYLDGVGLPCDDFRPPRLAETRLFWGPPRSICPSTRQSGCGLFRPDPRGSPQRVLRLSAASPVLSSHSPWAAMGGLC